MAGTTAPTSIRTSPTASSPISNAAACRGRNLGIRRPRRRLSRFHATHRPGDNILGSTSSRFGPRSRNANSPGIAGSLFVRLWLPAAACEKASTASPSSMPIASPLMQSASGPARPEKSPRASLSSNASRCSTPTNAKVCPLTPQRLCLHPRRSFPRRTPSSRRPAPIISRRRRGVLSSRSRLCAGSPGPRIFRADQLVSDSFS